MTHCMYPPTHNNFSEEIIKEIVELEEKITLTDSLINRLRYKRRLAKLKRLKRLQFVIDIINTVVTNNIVY